jgi:hypothetical protein
MAPSPDRKVGLAVDSQGLHAAAVPPLGASVSQFTASEHQGLAEGTFLLLVERLKPPVTRIENESTLQSHV